MIKLYSAGTTRGVPPCILLEELGLDYEVVICDLHTETAPHVKVNPLARIPVLQDGDRVLDQYPAILFYLAEKYGRFLPKAEPQRSETLRMFMHTVTDVLPAHVNIFQLLRFPGPLREDQLARERGLLLKDVSYCNQILTQKEWLADELSIADMALYAIVGQYDSGFLKEYQLGGLEAWLVRMRGREAVRAAERRCPYGYDVSTTLIGELRKQ